MHNPTSRSLQGSAKLLDAAKVERDAVLLDNVIASGNARITGCARVFGNVQISGRALITGNAVIGGNTIITGGFWNGSEGEILSGIWDRPPGHPPIVNYQGDMLRAALDGFALCFDSADAVIYRVEEGKAVVYAFVSTEQEGDFHVVNASVARPCWGLGLACYKAALHAFQYVVPDRARVSDSARRVYEKFQKDPSVLKSKLPRAMLEGDALIDNAFTIENDPIGYREMCQRDSEYGVPLSQLTLLGSQLFSEVL